MKELVIQGPKSNHKPILKGFAEYFFEKAAELKDRIFQIDGDTEKSETYGQVKARSIKLALAMKSLDFKPRDVALVCCKNNLDNIIPILGTLYLGGCVSSADPRLSLDDIKYFIGLVRPKLMFVDQDSVNTVEKALCESTSCESTARLVVMGNSDKYPTMKSIENQFYENEKTFIMFSSGTTSSPKGVYISNKSAMNAAIYTFECGSVKPGMIMHFASFYWVSALICTSVCVLTGSTKIIGSNISAEKYLYLTDKYKITYTFMSNNFTHSITSLSQETIDKYDTSSLYSLLIGGAPVNPSQMSKLRRLLPHTKVSMGYGSTETIFISCFDFKNREAYETKIGSSGKLLADVQLKIADLETGKPLGPNQEGEIRIKSPYVTSGYHHLDKTDIFDEDGFIKMGDLGYYDDDHYIYVTDRIKEIFKYQNGQVTPSIIENTLLSHPAVEEAAAFDIPHRVDDNHPAALVVLKPDQSLEAKELIDFTDQHLTDSHRLRGGVIIVNSIPRTPSGKVQRRILKDFFGKNPDPRV
ncbi:4-coumarate--CoA ligase 1-like isoform X2 [Sitophilus oryzae]|uniref:4-coumarate--CoA ligase 1-like isoform X2 n=1 Tax=Sitophilus oryzae TaxID=7048 RepID=A0A6J2YVP7_SITOR|nr:4-coumarate--CoA ligase 1-like isoform X2 [Sitophilus oryzae]